MPIPRGQLTTILALVTAALWLIAELGGWQDWAVLGAGFIPARVGDAVALPGALPVWITPLSAAFVHGGIAHLAFNMLMLFFCGNFVEHVVGKGPMAALYIVGAFAAAGAQYLADPLSPVPMVGASGAISAVVGAYAIYFGRRRARKIGPIPAQLVHALWLAAGWIAIQALMGVAMSSAGTMIAVFAHIGGFLAGMAMARPMLMWRYRHA